MDGISELAKMFKERDNEFYLGPQVGKVLSPPPEIKVLLGDKIILTNKKLIIAAHLLAGYQRSIEIPETEATGTMTSVNDGGQGASNHTHEIETIGLTGTIKYMKTLSKGDKVILIPSTDEQKYYILDKAVKL